MKAPLDPTDPRTWLARARSNLRLAEVGYQQGVFLEDLCFEAQQAAEKALKALCVWRGLDFPKTRSLVLLMDILEESAALSIPPEVKAADVLTQYAVHTRYPGWGEEVTEAEYHRALELAAGPWRGQLRSWKEQHDNRISPHCRTSRRHPHQRADEGRLRRQPGGSVKAFEVFRPG